MPWRWPCHSLIVACACIDYRLFLAGTIQGRRTYSFVIIYVYPWCTAVCPGLPAFMLGPLTTHAHSACPRAPSSSAAVTCKLFVVVVYLWVVIRCDPVCRCILCEWWLSGSLLVIPSVVSLASYFLSYQAGKRVSFYQGLFRNSEVC